MIIAHGVYTDAFLYIVEPVLLIEVTRVGIRGVLNYAFLLITPSPTPWCVALVTQRYVVKLRLAHDETGGRRRCAEALAGVGFEGATGHHSG